jgi:hypothetical protein
MPSIEEVAQPMLRLAGLRINPRNNGPHGRGGCHRHHAADDLDGRRAHREVPAERADRRPELLARRQALRVHQHAENAIDLHIGDVATGQTRKVDGALNG